MTLLAERVIGFDLLPPSKQVVSFWKKLHTRSFESFELLQDGVKLITGRPLFCGTLAANLGGSKLIGQFDLNRNYAFPPNLVARDIF